MNDWTKEVEASATVESLAAVPDDQVIVMPYVVPDLKSHRRRSRRGMELREHARRVRDDQCPLWKHAVDCLDVWRRS